MKNAFINLFQPDESALISLEARKRSMMRGILFVFGSLSALVLIIVFGFARLYPRTIPPEMEIYTYLSAFIGLMGTLISAFFERKGSTQIATYIFLAMFGVAVLLADSPGELIHGSGTMFLLLPVVLTGIFLSTRAAYLMVVVISILLVLGWYVVDKGQWTPNFVAMTALIFLAFLIQWPMSFLEKAVKKLEETNQSLRESETRYRRHNERLQEVSRQLLEVQEREKHALSVELHDDLGQSLTSLKMTLELADSLPVADTRKKLHEAADLVYELMGKVRDISLNLRPAILDDFGLFPALSWLFDRLASRMHLEIHANFDLESEQRFDPDVEVAAFRIIQEALTNIARYASVKEAFVSLKTDSFLRLCVEDHGQGFDLADVSERQTLSGGLSGMQERARLVGGRVDIFSEPGQGTRIAAEIPLSQNGGA